MDIHNKMMTRALELAQEAFDADEVPVGAVIYTENGTVVAEARNRVEALKNPTAHAEMLAIQAACQELSTKKLSDCYMAVSLEPCAMCAQAISFSRLKELRFGAYDVKSGGAVNGARVFSAVTCHHKPEIYGGMLEDACAAILKRFFENKR